MTDELLFIGRISWNNILNLASEWSSDGGGVSKPKAWWEAGWYRELQYINTFRMKTMKQNNKNLKVFNEGMPPHHFLHDAHTSKTAPFKIKTRQHSSDFNSLHRSITCILVIYWHTSGTRSSDQCTITKFRLPVTKASQISTHSWKEVAISLCAAAGPGPPGSFSNKPNLEGF